MLLCGAWLFSCNFLCKKLDSLTIILEVLRFDSVDILCAWGCLLTESKALVGKRQNSLCVKHAFLILGNQNILWFSHSSSRCKAGAFSCDFLYIKNGGPRAAVLNYSFSFCSSSPRLQITLFFSF